MRRGRRHWRRRMNRRVTVRRVLQNHVAEACGEGHAASIFAAVAEERIDRDDAGRIVRRYHVEGEQLEGECTTWDADGWLAQRANFKTGKLDGELVQYDANGDVTAVLRFVNGVLDGEATYFNRGRPQVKMIYARGVQDGPTILFGENEKPISRAEYKAGKLDGTSSWFRPDGSLLRTAEYKEGMLDGDTIDYDERGRISERTRYAANELVERVKK